ncbi:hypothetical protein GN956_G23822 [Arapaima gigas]
MSRIVSGDHFLDYRFQKEEKPKAKSGLESSYQKTTSFNSRYMDPTESSPAPVDWYLMLILESSWHTK